MSSAYYGIRCKILFSKTTIFSLPQRPPKFLGPGLNLQFFQRLRAGLAAVTFIAVRYFRCLFLHSRSKIE